jgi:dTDP-4-dehydrorhamnose 3,5-epimerase
MIYQYTPQSSDLLSQGIYKTPIDGLFFIPHQAHFDKRGHYVELGRIPEIEQVIGRPFQVKQINASGSKQNVIRGIHAEGWDKLLSIATGTAFCAWPDLRPESPTFGDVVTMTLGAEEQDLSGSVYVSNGIGNSFYVLNGPLTYLYVVNALYKDRDVSNDVAISLFDEDLNINWPSDKASMIISDRDLQAITLRTKFPEKFI